MARTKEEWDGLVIVANQISKILKRKPRQFRRRYSLDPGSILNAYREGDIAFNQAVKLLEQWRKWKNKNY